MQKRFKNLRKPINKMRFLNLLKNAETDQKYAETDQKFQETDQQNELLKVFGKSGNGSKICGNGSKI